MSNRAILSLLEAVKKTNEGLAGLYGLAKVINNVDFVDYLQTPTQAMQPVLDMAQDALETCILRADTANGFCRLERLPGYVTEPLRVFYNFLLFADCEEQKEAFIAALRKFCCDEESINSILELIGVEELVDAVEAFTGEPVSEEFYILLGY